MSKLSTPFSSQQLLLKSQLQDQIIHKFSQMAYFDFKLDIMPAQESTY